MADTLITNTTPSTNDSGAGWVVAIVILLAVIAGGLYWYRYGLPAAQPTSTNINVTVPTPAAVTPPTTPTITTP